MARTKKIAEKTWEAPSGRLYSTEDVRRLRQARDILSEVFDWDDSKEGHEHWSNLYDRLDHMADEIERRIESGFDASF